MPGAFVRGRAAPVQAAAPAAAPSSPAAVLPGSPAVSGPFTSSYPNGLPRPMHGGGWATPLADGSWNLGWKDLSIKVSKHGARFGWDRTNADDYIVEYDPTEVRWHIGQQVISRTRGGLVYHQPDGFVSINKTGIVYHFCNPNLIIYATQAGTMYYSADGLTYRGDKGVVHYAPSGEVVYQGVEGITRNSPDGTITHWTPVGVLYSHPDGTVDYTPVGESKPRPMIITPVPPVEPQAAPPEVAPQPAAAQPAPPPPAAQA